MPFLLPAQSANLALLVRAILIKRTLCQTELARTFPQLTGERQVPNPKHELLYRVKRLSRFLANEDVDPQKVQIALLPSNWNASVVTLGKAGLVFSALVFLDDAYFLPQVFKPT